MMMSNIWINWCCMPCVRLNETSKCKNMYDWYWSRWFNHRQRHATVQINDLLEINRNKNNFKPNRKLPKLKSKWNLVGAFAAFGCDLHLHYSRVNTAFPTHNNHAYLHCRSCQSTEGAGGQGKNAERKGKTGSWKEKREIESSWFIICDSIPACT